MREIHSYTSEKEWLALRTKDITSTESAALFGMSPYVTHFDLWHRKRTGIVPEFEVNERMLAGQFLEPAIAALIAHRQGWQIQPMKTYQRLAVIRAGSSFDFEIIGGEPTHLEIKNVDYMAFRDGWLIEDGFVEAPAHIEMQVQHQMMVSGYRKSFIGALIGGNRIELIERERDEKVIAAIRHRIAEFWQSIADGREPDPIMPSDADAVIRMNAFAEPGKILDAGSDEKITALVQRYKAQSAQAKQAEEDAKVTKAELLTAIGDAEKVLLNGYSISAGIVADSPGTLVTQEMVGTFVNPRRGYRNCRIYERKAK